MKKVLYSLLISLFGLVAFTIAQPTKASAAIDNSPDCDTVAIVKCGAYSPAEIRADYDGANGRSSYNDVDRVYNAFGITKEKLQNDSSFKNGIVWRNGNVTVDGVVVATNAITAGRWNSQKSGMTRISGTDRAYKMPTSYFATEGQTAFVKFDANGKFMFAVMKSCGNPVTAKPLPPSFNCEALGAAALSRTQIRFNGRASANDLVDIRGYELVTGDGKKLSQATSSNNVTFNYNYTKPGTYKATLFVVAKYKTNGGWYKKTSAACERTFTINNPPAYACEYLHFTQLSRDTFRFNAKAGAAGGAKVIRYTYDFGDGTVRSGASNELTSFATYQYKKPGNYTARVTVRFVAEGKEYDHTTTRCTAPIRVTEEPKVPTYSCDLLTATKLSRTGYRFQATGAANNGATIRDYTINFGDGQSTTTANGAAEHTYATPGEYTIRATANVLLNGQVIPTTSDACVVKINIDQAPQYACTLLTAQVINAEEMTYKYTLTYEATNGATLQTVNFNFGDGESQNGVTPAQLANVQHSYDRPGNYTTTATLQFNVGGEVRSVNCETPITIAACPTKPEYPVGSPECDEPVCPQNPNLPPNHPDCKEPECPYNPQLPPNHPECKPETPKCPYNPELPVNSPDCEKPTTPPVELPKTGPGAVALAAGIVGTLAAAGHAIISRRIMQ